MTSEHKEIDLPSPIEVAAMVTADSPGDKATAAEEPVAQQPRAAQEQESPRHEKKRKERTPKHWTHRNNTETVATVTASAEAFIPVSVAEAPAEVLSAAAAVATTTTTTQDAPHTDKLSHEHASAQLSASSPPVADQGGKKAEAKTSTNTQTRGRSHSSTDGERSSSKSDADDARDRANGDQGEAEKERRLTHDARAAAKALRRQVREEHRRARQERRAQRQEKREQRRLAKEVRHATRDESQQHHHHHHKRHRRHSRDDAGHETRREPARSSVPADTAPADTNRVTECSATRPTRSPSQPESTRLSVVSPHRTAPPKEVCHRPAEPVTDAAILLTTERSQHQQQQQQVTSTRDTVEPRLSHLSFVSQNDTDEPTPLTGAQPHVHRTISPETKPTLTRGKRRHAPHAESTMLSQPAATSDKASAQASAVREPSPTQHTATPTQRKRSRTGSQSGVTAQEDTRHAAPRSTRTATREEPPRRMRARRTVTEPPAVHKEANAVVNKSSGAENQTAELPTRDAARRRLQPSHVHDDPASQQLGRDAVATVDSISSSPQPTLVLAGAGHVTMSVTHPATRAASSQRVSQTTTAMEATAADTYRRGDEGAQRVGGAPTSRDGVPSRVDGDGYEDAWNEVEYEPDYRHEASQKRPSCPDRDEAYGRGGSHRCSRASVTPAASVTSSPDSHAPMHEEQQEEQQHPQQFSAALAQARPSGGSSVLPSPSLPQESPALVFTPIYNSLTEEFSLDPSMANSSSNSADYLYD